MKKMVLNLVGPVFVSLIAVVVSQTPVLSPSGPTFVDENEELVLTTTYEKSADAPLLVNWVRNNNSSLKLLVPECEPTDPPVPTGYSVECTNTGTTYTFTLTIASINKTDEGQTWQSFISNKAVVVGSVETLTIRVRVPIVSVTLTTQTAITVLEGTQATFECDTSESSPSSTITWYKDQNTATTTDDQQITTGVTTSDVPLDSGTITRGTLRYSPSKQDNEWSVFCRASNVGPLFTSGKCRLTVHYPPTLTSISNKSIVAGQRLSQKCTVSDGNPTEYTYRWTRGAGSWSRSHSALSLPSVQTADSATYTCTVQNTMTPTGQDQQTGEDTESFVLEVLSPPTPPRYSYKNQALSGTTLSFIFNTPGDSLRCESTGNPSPNYGWRRQGEVISTSQDLTLSSIQRDRGGVYTCMAYNTLSPTTEGGGGPKSNTTTITFNVLYPPITPSLKHETSSGLSIPGNRLKVVRGDTVKVVCLADSNPGPRYQWSGQRGDSQILTINNIQNDTRHTCTATNTMQPTNSGTPVSRSASTTVTISVMSPPTTPTFTYNNKPVSGTTLNFIHGTHSDYLRCGSTGNPSPDYKWQRQGASGDISTSLDLTLSTIQNDRGGVYKCIAYNTLSPSYGSGGGNKSSTTKITLNVLYPPITPSLKHETSSGPLIPGNSLKVVQGDNVKVACSAVSNPGPRYKWSSQRDDSQILTINNIKTDTTHTCTATTTMQATNSESVSLSASTKVTISVLFAPTEPTLEYNYMYNNYWLRRTITLTEPLLMIKGDSGTVLCSGSNSKPAPDAYTWYSNSGLSATGATLNINHVTKHKAGIQICRVTNTMDRTFGNDITGEYNKSLTVSVLYPPSISPIYPPHVNEGTPLSVRCATTAGNPPQTTYTWTRSGDNSWRQNTQTFTIQGATRTDTRVYTCKAENIMVPTKPSSQQQGVDTKTVRVTVEYTPDVTVTTTNTTINDNTVDIVCSPSGVPSTYTFQPWTQHWTPGVEIIHTPGLSNNPTLQLTQLSYQHSGIYTCTAGNGVLASNNPGAGSGRVYLLVKSHPIITFPNIKKGFHPVSASLNADVNITIQYYTNADVTNIKLAIYNASIGGEEVQNFNHTTSDTNVNLTVFNKPVLTPGKLLTLTMAVTDESQFGFYKLDINNEMGNGTVFINLIPESPPDAPTLQPISESDITEHSISISWVPGFHGGFDQTFVIQWSDDNKSWNNKSIPSDQSLSKIPLTVTIESLIPSTKYYIRIFAENEKGTSPYTQDVMPVTTLEAKTDETSTLLLAAIIGSVCGLIVIVIIGVICKRRQQKPKAKAFGENNQSNAYHNDDDEEIDTVNPMYDSSQPMLEASNNDVYAQVNKPKKKEDNVYAMVDKSNKKKPGIDDSAQLYAIPDKTKAKKKDPKKEDKKKKGKGRQNRQAAGDIYENAPACAFAAKPEENLYDSAEVPQPMPAYKRNVNADGLLYAELDLPTNPGSQKSPPVIHGLDDMTEYSEVDFTKKAEPLPDSDEEDANAKK